MEKPDIKDFTIGDFKREMQKKHLPSYRALQIFNWIYKKGVCDFKGMTDIPLELQDKLSRMYYIGNIDLSEKLESIDGTEKFVFKLKDGSLIETVLIHSKHRDTACISTQVGCKYACRFCASGLRGFKRDMSTSEIHSQILFLKFKENNEISNIVFMGMGEPFDNYENVIKSILIMNSPEGLGIGARRMTVSTCGITPAIEKFRSLKIQVNLSISLHATNNKLKDELMPVNKKYPLEELIKACERYVEDTNRKITLEYVLLKGKNDSSKDAEALSIIAKRLGAKVNLIPYSVIKGKDFKAPDEGDIERFRDHLIKNRVDVFVRDSKGQDIQAACGQLAMKK